jgi:hypothetical protein
MNIFRRIKRLFIPEWHTFLLKNGEDIELRVYRNGIRVNYTDLYKTKKGNKILAEYLEQQKIDDLKRLKK